MLDICSAVELSRRHLSFPSLQRRAQSGERESEPTFGCLAICARHCRNLLDTQSTLGLQQERLTLQDRERFDRLEQVCAKRCIVYLMLRLVLNWSSEAVRLRRLRLPFR